MNNREKKSLHFWPTKTADTAFNWTQSIVRRVSGTGYSPMPFVVGLVLTAVILCSIYSSLTPRLADYVMHNDISMAMFADGTVTYLFHGHAQTSFSYAAYHWLLAKFVKMTTMPVETCSAWILVLAAIATIVIYRKILRFELSEYCDTKIAYLIDIAALFSVFIGTIVSGLGNSYHYAYISSANVWHNPTILFMRPFGIVMLWLYVRIIRKIKEGKIDAALLAKFGLCSLLCVYAKPSGFMVVGPVMAVYTLVLFFKDMKLRFRPCLGLLISIVPTLVLMLTLMHLESTGENTFGVIFNIGTPWDINAAQELAYVLSAALFGILVLIIQRGNIFKNELYGVTVLSFFSAWLQFYFLAESGWRFSHGNFGWGYIFALNLLLVFSFIPLLKERSPAKITVLVSVYAVHFIFGMQYIIGTFKGLNYWR